jgi:hypothetical protein
MDKEDKKTKIERTTKTGEFIPSFDNWLKPEIQKKRAEELEDITREKK